MSKRLHSFTKGFTLIELLVVIAILGMLATVSIYAINPGRQFAKARDTERESEIYAILSAILQYASEHSGELPDTDGNPATSNFPASLTCIGSGGGCFNLGAAGATGETIVPVYLAQMPADPKATNPTSDTLYRIMVDTNGRLTASASGETKTISVTR